MKNVKDKPLSSTTKRILRLAVVFLLAFIFISSGFAVPTDPPHYDGECCHITGELCLEHEFTDFKISNFSGGYVTPNSVQQIF